MHILPLLQYNIPSDKSTHYDAATVGNQFLPNIHPHAESRIK